MLNTDDPPATKSASSISPLLLGGLPFIVFALLLLHTAWEKSPTFDEVGYIGLGAYLLESGKWDVPAAASHPPLAYYLHSLPALLYPLDPQHWRYDDSIERDDIRWLRAADVDRGNAILLDPAYDGEFFFFLCRSTSLVFAALLFYLLYHWSIQIQGQFLLALLLLALSPNILAHAALINTDFIFTVTFLLTVYTFRHLLLQPSWRNLSLAGFSLGLALLSKLSALILLPVLGALLLWFIVCARQDNKKNLVTFWPGSNLWTCGIALYATIVLAGFLTLWAGYGFQLTPYLLVVRSQLWDLSGGHQAYLAGAYSTEGWWYYYPVAALIKTPLPTLILAGLGLACLIRRSDRLELGFLLLPPLLLSAVFIVIGSKNIGLRYLLPAYPFLFLVAATALPSLTSTAAWRKYLVGLLCLWYIVGAARIHPHHLAYFNEAIGGPQNGYRYLVDSNLDWGQDLKGLKKYMDERGITRIKLSYFGTVDPALYDLDYDWLPSYMLHRPSDTEVILPTTGLIAISATNLTGVYMDMYGYGKTLYDWLWQRQPIAQIGYSIFIYDLPQPP